MHLYSNKKSGNRKLEIGDVVLIRDKNYLPRQKWRLGKVEELVVGKDGNIRSARLKVHSNTGVNFCHRPVQKLIPFEIVERDSSVDKQDKGALVQCTRPTRKAAIEGTIIRQLRERGENVKSDSYLLFCLICLICFETSPRLIFRSLVLVMCARCI